MSKSAKYKLKLADGSEVVGAVHGAGGIVGHGPHNAGRIQQAIRQANRGRETHLYEPKPGHCAMYLDDRFEDQVVVDLRGAELLTEVES